MKTLERTLDVLVIGGGQAGLALGYYLQQTPYRFQIVESNARIGDSWRKRYDSLVLFTPRAFSALPGLPVPGDPQGYATKDEIADYLATYAQHFDLPVVTGTGIQSLERYQDGYRATTRSGVSIDTRAVVVASGAFQRPAVPAIAQGLSPDVLQLTPASYRRPAQVPPGRVVVVGDGATGRQIAVELAATHQVMLATGRPRRVMPERILGRSIYWWLDKLGVLGASRESRVGRYLMRTDPFPGKALGGGQLLQRGIQVVGRVVEMQGKRASFAGGTSVDLDTVIWATGYRDDADWVAIPAIKDARGAFVHQHGVSSVPGLYFIGRPWQWTRGSALLHGVGADAAFLAGRITAQLSESTTPQYPVLQHASV